MTDMQDIYQATIEVGIEEAYLMAEEWVAAGAYSATLSPEKKGQMLEIVITAGSPLWFLDHGISAIPTRVEPSRWQHQTHRFRGKARLTKTVTVVSSLNSDAKSDSQTIILDPRDAFGDGHHPTTQLCAQFLEEWGHHRSLGHSLDMGCGTGVLGILASKMGALSVTAVDIEADSVKKTRRNATLNQVVLNVKKASVLSWDPKKKWDTVVANLHTSLIEAALPRLLSWMTPQGVLILSGVDQKWKKEVSSLLNEQGLFFKVRTKKGWCGFKVELGSSAF